MNFHLNEEVNLDHNISIKALIVPLEYISTIESKDDVSQMNHKLLFVERISSSLDWKPYANIQNAIYIILKKRKLSITQLFYSFSTDCNDTILTNISQDGRSPLSILSDTPSCFPIQYETSSAHNEKIKLHFKYTTDGKTKEIDCFLKIESMDPITIESINVISAGCSHVYCNVLINNALNIHIYKVLIKFKYLPFFSPLINDEDNEKIEGDQVLAEISKINMHDTYSKIFRFEFSRSDDANLRKINIGTLSLFFSLSDVDLALYPNRRYKVTFPNTFEYVAEQYDKFPLLIEKIGSPKSVEVLKPFGLKVGVYNSSNADINFTLNILTNPHNYLSPYGSHLIKGSIGKGGHSSYNLTFIGLKYGLLQYPPFIIELEDGTRKLFPQDDGVFILQDPSILE